MAGITANIYNAIFRRNQSFLAIVFVSAFGLEMVWDTGSQRLWDYVNKGRQWKDIKHKYMQTEDDE